MVNRTERPTKNAIVNPINASGLLMVGKFALSGWSLGFGQLIVVDMILLDSTAVKLPNPRPVLAWTR
jgi:hypothetical protein